LVLDIREWGELNVAGSGVPTGKHRVSPLRVAFRFAKRNAPVEMTMHGPVGMTMHGPVEMTMHG